MKSFFPLDLVGEVERSLYAFSPAWEGIIVREIPLGVADIVVRVQSGFATAMPLHFETFSFEQQVQRAVQAVQQLAPWCLWIIGPGSSPSDLEQRLLQSGFTLRMEWDGLVLTDLSLPFPVFPSISVEPLSWENSDAYAVAVSGSTDSAYYVTLLETAHRFLEKASPEVQFFLARFNGVVAGYAVLRVEPNGIAYLRNARTLFPFRQRGVYLSLVAHRLAQARQQGCTAAVVQALVTTSSPILMKRGFVPVCRFAGLSYSLSSLSSSSK